MRGQGIFDIAKRKFPPGAKTNVFGGRDFLDCRGDKSPRNDERGKARNDEGRYYMREIAAAINRLAMTRGEMLVMAKIASIN